MIFVYHMERFLHVSLVVGLCLACDRHLISARILYLGRTASVRLGINGLRRFKRLSFRIMRTLDLRNLILTRGHFLRAILHRDLQ